jgi:short-subunit dehydrogenase
MVGVSGRRQELLTSLQKEYPRNIVIEKFDVMGKENIPYLQSLIQKLDGLDILIYNSGYGETSSELDWDIEKRTVDTNVNGFVEIVSYAFKYFVNQGHGQLAATSSIASIRGLSHAPAYSASKAFMSNYMEGLWIKASKLKKDISVTDIQPGFVDTHLVEGQKTFWVAKPSTAAEQMYTAIHNRRKKVYVTHRWWIIAIVLKWLPSFIYKRFV